MTHFITLTISLAAILTYAKLYHYGMLTFDQSIKGFWALLVFVYLMIGLNFLI
jgi:hypothetical protein